MKIAFILSVTILGIPFMGSGYTLGILFIIALTIFMFSYKKIQMKVLNTIFVSLMVIVIGYSTFALILIRADAETPMNQNNPSDIFTLRSYLAREQYGEVPLIHGRTYVSEEKRENNAVVRTKGTPTWSRIIKDNSDENDRYDITSTNDKPVFIEETCMLFPRMHSSAEQAHVDAYKSWGQVTGTPVRINSYGEVKTVMKPTFVENLRFFFNYQVNFMYWRYFMWNFAGRQNDIQGHGDVMKGNWITGIKFIDQFRVGPQDNLPPDITDNKGHNKYYMLPLILGIFGIAFQVLKKETVGIQSFWITFFLFFMTGLAIVIYLNQPPLQPRERDYAYAGSFYAFCIWIGIGVAGVAKLLEKTKLSPVAIASISSVACLLVPLQMASQTWDDHDRSNRTIARDFGSNYLESCEPDAIIFTMGDNDTFPLWYAQEVEGIRTDVRVCNTSYLQTDWYINQMKKQAYDSPPLPISWDKKDYAFGKRNFFHVLPNPQYSQLNLSQVLTFLKSNDQRNQINSINFFPTRRLILKIDSATVVNNKTLNPEYEPDIIKEMTFSLEAKNYATIVDVMILEMINTNNWERPIYFASTVPYQVYNFIGENNLQKTGFAYQLVPLDNNGASLINTEKMYDNVMNKFKWGGVDKYDVYLDETAMTQCKGQRQNLFAPLARALMAEGKNDKALNVINKCIEVFPERNVPFDLSIAEMAIIYFELGETGKAKEIASKVIDYSLKTLDWMYRLKPSEKEAFTRDIYFNMSVISTILNISQRYDSEFRKPYNERFEYFLNLYQSTQTAQ
jgi:hypothetical protein